MFLSSITEPEQLSPSVLAYIGDAVYELAVRSFLVGSGMARVNCLHNEAVKYVRAETQAKVLHALEGQLTDEEKAVVRRGRNTHSAHPRRTGVMSHRYSTALESLIGYLYLKEDSGRLEEILNLARRVVGDGL